MQGESGGATAGGEASESWPFTFMTYNVLADMLVRVNSLGPAPLSPRDKAPKQRLPAAVSGANRCGAARQYLERQHIEVEFMTSGIQLPLFFAIFNFQCTRSTPQTRKH